MYELLRLRLTAGMVAVASATVAASFSGLVALHEDVGALSRKRRREGKMIPLNKCPCGSQIYHAACFQSVYRRIYSRACRSCRVQNIRGIAREEVGKLAKAKKKSGKKKGAGSKMSGTKTGK